MFSSIFIDRPRLAFVIAIVITLAGVINDHLTSVADPRNLKTAYAWDGLHDQTAIARSGSGMPRARPSCFGPADRCFGGWRRARI
jgi:hypothetical protein